jgi:hypothetical protein
MFREAISNSDSHQGQTLRKQEKKKLKDTLGQHIHSEYARYTALARYNHEIDYIAILYY